MTHIDALAIGTLLFLAFPALSVITGFVSYRATGWALLFWFWVVAGIIALKTLQLAPGMFISGNLAILFNLVVVGMLAVVVFIATSLATFGFKAFKSYSQRSESEDESTQQLIKGAGFLVLLTTVVGAILTLTITLFDIPERLSKLV